MTIPDWLLERYAVDEVSDAERALVEADPDHRDQLAALRASNADIHAAYSAVQVAAVARQRARGRWRPAIGVALALATAVALFLVWPTPDGHRAKGMAAELAVYRQTADGHEPLADGALVQPGQVLQLETIRGDSPHAWLLSIDGSGVVTLHNDGHLEPGRVAIPRGYKLDDAPRFEHFFLVSTDAPLSREAIAAAAADAATSDPPAFDLDAEIVRFEVRKP